MSRRHDIIIEQKATFNLKLQYMAPDNVTPINLTGWSAAAKAVVGTSTTITFTVTITPLTGTIVVSLTNTQTTALAAPATGRWDLILTDASGKVQRLLEGIATVTPGVTP